MRLNINQMYLPTIIEGLLKSIIKLKKTMNTEKRNRIIFEITN